MLFLFLLLLEDLSPLLLPHKSINADFSKANGGGNMSSGGFAKPLVLRAQQLRVPLLEVAVPAEELVAEVVKEEMLAEVVGSLCRETLKIRV